MEYLGNRVASIQTCLCINNINYYKLSADKDAARLTAATESKCNRIFKNM